MERATLTRFAWLSIAAALLTIALKAAAYVITGSVGLLSDALESLVNLVAAIIALIALTIAARPPDAEHAYGHSKAEYFSSVVEGALILLAAASIAVTAIPRLIAPEPIEQVGLGLGVSVAASLVNLGVALVLRRAARTHRSITLEADAEHLLTDVWTSAGVVVAVLLVAITGWLRLDPIIALLVAANIIWAGVRLVRRSTLGLMDTALPEQQRNEIRMALARYEAQGITFHAIRTRQAAARSFISMHVLVPGDWTVQRGHELLESIEAEIRTIIPNTTVDTHLEPLNDPTSWADTQLDRGEVAANKER
ncbi:MAG TPA: cation diffusion facilitator family transporter [Roseiflexaceae bacterium]|nr:cation diffusion facilitator family transporter [Roseiflexaceae bacterium]